MKSRLNVLANFVPKWIQFGIFWDVPLGDELPDRLPSWCKLADEEDGAILADIFEEMQSQFSVLF
jgi:hypothetical protein